MADFLHNFALGFGVALSASNLLYCFFGVFIGTLIGVLPGIGPVGAISMLLPVTFGIDPTSAIIMLAGIYYGAQYGGSTSSILVNIPGEVTSVISCIDGYQMARQGRAGPALGIAAFGSFIAGTIGTIILMFVAVPLSSLANTVGPPEYTTLIFLALTLLSSLSQGSKKKAAVTAVLGIYLGLIGTDGITGRLRFTFGLMELQDGIGLVPLVMGLFGISEVLINLEESMSTEVFKAKIKGLLPSLSDWRASIGPILRGSFLGFFLGVLPGGGAIISTFMSYGIERRLSKTPERFGKGAIEGLAGPESANNAASSGAFIPLFILGFPSNAITALLLGALMVHGIQPGPALVSKHPEIFWGTIASMYIGNVMLVALNLPLIRLWIQILKVPYRILFPMLILLCLIGSYSINNSKFDMIIMIAFGILGYVLRRFRYQLPPLAVAFVLTPILETAMRQSLLISGGNPAIFIRKPIALVCLLIALTVLILPWVLRKSSRDKRYTNPGHEADSVQMKGRLKDGKQLEG